ncbi:UNVERIFIED_ORG: hypothetical protein EDC92_1486 [Dietzia maris]|uniref:hypothetical protein n=1 Tax=Dietzia maris TaxID=37915 RepID=UPI0010DD77A3
MSRPPLEIGTYGAVTLLEVSPGRWRARANIRDRDGVTRRMERFGTSKSGAERRLKAAIRDRLHMAGDEDITPDSTLANLAEVWLTTVEREGKLSPQTLEKYRRTVTKHINQGVGGLRIREATVGKLDRFLAAIESDANARWCRVILTGMLGLAARRDAIPSNPMRDTERRSAPAPVVRAMTLDEVHTLRSNVAAWAGSNKMGPPTRRRPRRASRHHPGHRNAHR